MSPTQSESPTEIGTEASTVRTETPTPGTSEAAEYIRKTREHVEIALTAYVQYADSDDPELIDVKADASDFSRFDVDQACGEALDDVSRARELATGDEVAIADDLKQAIELIITMAFAQIHVINAHDRMDSVRQTFYRGEYDSVGDETDRMRDHLGNGDPYRAELSEADLSVFKATESVTSAAVDEKRQQFEDEYDSLKQLATLFDDLVEAMLAFSSDTSNYLSEDYEEVTYETSLFESARDELDSLPRPESTDPMITELTCICDGIIAGSGEMQEAVLARQDGNTNTAEAAEQDAKTAFESCEVLAQEVQPVVGLIRSL